MEVDNDVFYIALSPNGSQLVSLSPRHIKLYNLESKACLAHSNFSDVLGSLGNVQASFTSNGMGISVKNSDGTKHWRISHIHNIQTTKAFIKNNDGTKSWLHHQTNIHNSVSSLPMVFLPSKKKCSHQAASVQSQSYHCSKDGEWILDQHERRVLWIPPDERPRRSWCFERTVIIKTKGEKVYIVQVSPS